VHGAAALQSDALQRSRVEDKGRVIHEGALQARGWCFNFILFYFYFFPRLEGSGSQGRWGSQVCFSFWFRCSGFGHQPPVQISKQAPELENAFH
jgi:hypothetical protein